MMNAADVIELYDQLASLGIDIWLDGGWAVDALLGKETRPHKDVDIVIEQKHVPTLRNLFASKGYKNIPRDDTSSWNFVLGDDKDHVVDVHVVVFDKNGNGIYGSQKDGVMYPADSLAGNGLINGQPVKCISVEYLIKFHGGYPLDNNDRQDVALLCKQFSINLPEEYIK